EFHGLRIGEAGYFAIEAASTRDINIIGALGKEIENGIYREGPDVSVATVGADFINQAPGQLVVNELELDQCAQPRIEIEAAANGQVSAPCDVIGRAAGRRVE